MIFNSRGSIFSSDPHNSKQKLTLQLYSHPSCEFAAVATRFALPPRSLAFFPDGRTLAAGGDDEGIKVISLSSSSSEENNSRLDLLSKPRVLRTLPAPPYTRGLAWDPEGVYLASVDASGSVTVWEGASADPSAASSAGAGAASSASASAARPEVVLRRVAAKLDAGGPARCPVAWHPDGGSLLAVAGAEPGEALLFERLSWAPAASGSGDDGVLRMGDDDGEGGENGKGGHVRVLSFSPNGLYLLSGDEAGNLAVWDVSSARRRVVARAKIGGSENAAPSAAAWRPGGNEVAVVDESGAVSVWRSPLPASLPGPAADPEAVLAAAAAAGGMGAKAATKTATGATEDDDELSDGEEEDDDDEEETGDEMEEDGKRAEPIHNKRPRSQLLPPRVASHIRQAPISPGSTKPDRNSGNSFSSASSGGKSHRWLAYNSLGSVSSRRGDGCAVVEVSLHDRSGGSLAGASSSSQAALRGGRVPLLNDFFGFDLAALGPKGVFYAAPPPDDGRRRGRRGGGDDDDSENDSEEEDEDAPRGVLVFRPFAGWAGGGGWTADLPKGRRAACVASGSTFAAAATTPDRCLRLFSPAGLQTAVSTLPGDPVALAAQSSAKSGGSLLAAVWHGPAPSDPRDQSLCVAVLDGSPVHGGGIGSGAAAAAADGPLAAVAAAAPLPLSRGASLTWLGFSDDGDGCLLASFDSKGVLRVRPALDAGAPWTPIFDARRAGVASAACGARGRGGRVAGARYWPVAFTRDKLHCVVHSAASGGGPGERPVVSVEPLRVPTLLLAGEATAGAAGGEEASSAAAAAAAAADLADASLRAGAFLHGVRSAAAAGMPVSSETEGGDGVSSPDLAIAAAEAAADRALLRAFHASLKARALERALEAAGRLCLTRSLEGALKLANHHRAPALAERVSALLSARLEMEQAMAMSFAEGAHGDGTPARLSAFGAGAGMGASPAAATAAEGNPFMRSSSGAATGAAAAAAPPPLAARDVNAATAAPASASAPPPPPKFSAASSPSTAAAEGGAKPAAAAVNPFLRKAKQPRA